MTGETQKRTTDSYRANWNTIWGKKTMSEKPLFPKIGSTTDLWNDACFTL